MLATAAAGKSNYGNEAKEKKVKVELFLLHLLLLNSFLLFEFAEKHWRARRSISSVAAVVVAVMRKC